MSLPSRLREGSGVGTIAGVRRPTHRAQELRREATPAERTLWRALSGSRTGYKFSRQMPVGPYICDFLCRSAALAIELDGESHTIDPAGDAARQRFIEQQDIRVLRFTNSEMMTNLEGVVARIVAVLEERAHPRPLPQAGGEL